MDQIISTSYILKRFGLFVLIYVGLALTFTFTPLKKWHNGYFASIITPLHNTFNPSTYAIFKKENSTDRVHYGIAISLFDKKNHGSKWNNKRYRKNARPEVIKYPNLHPLVLLPSLLIISLFMVTPINWKRKLLRSIVGVLIFYLVLVFYFSYVFELTLHKGQFSIDSFWDLIIRIFGADNVEAINLYAFLIWASLSGPVLFKKYSK